MNPTPADVSSERDAARLSPPPLHSSIGPVGECSIAATVSIIGDRWTLLILRDAFRGIRRFDEFHRDLGIARNLLTDRLTRLVQSGIMDKVAYQVRPERCEYRLTRKGIELSPSLVALMKWGDAWMVGEAGPPVVLVHDACGTPVEQMFHCPCCDTHVTPLQLRNRHQHTEHHSDSAAPSAAIPTSVHSVSAAPTQQDLEP